MIVKVLRPFESFNRILKVGQLIDEEKEAWRNTRLLIQQRYVEEYRGTDNPALPVIDFGLAEGIILTTLTTETEKTENKNPRGRPRKVSDSDDK